MADTDTQDPQEPQGGENTTPLEQNPTEPVNDGQGEENPNARGSKESLKADVANERDKRQAAEALAQETAGKLEAVLAALGLADKGDKVDPDKLAQDLTAQRAENAVLRAGNGIADVDALLDSRAFTDTLGDIDSSDRDAVKAHITEYVTANPRFAVAPQAHGVRDAAAGADPAPLVGSSAQQFAKWSTENFG